MRFDSNVHEILMNQLPTWFKPVLEYIELMNIHGAEMDSIEAYMQQIYNNFFIQTADEATIAQWENYFGLIVNFGDTLEFRRARVLQKFEQTIPYTIFHLREKMTELYGEDGYTLTVTPETNELRVFISSNRYGAIDLLYDLLWDVVPAHLRIIANQQVVNTVPSDTYVGGLLSRTFIQTIGAIGG